MTIDQKIARAADEIAVHHKVIGMPMRAYKDWIFRMIFKEKKELLELYNAMNGTEYTNEEDLIVTTLENAIYIGMKNDVSFVLYDKLTLYEHQSTKKNLHRSFLSHAWQQRIRISLCGIYSM